MRIHHQVSTALIVLTWLCLRSALGWIIDLSQPQASSSFVVEDDTTTPNPPWLDDVVLIKVGGSSITNKAVQESLNREALDWFAKSLAAQLHEHYLTTTTDSETLTCPTTIPSRSNHSKSAFIIIHGAGSFGHHTAKQYNLQGFQFQSSPDDASTRAPDPQQRQQQHQSQIHGIAHTRRSVQLLNHHVVSTLLAHNIPAVGISPCFGVLPAHAHGGGSSVEAIQINLQQLLHTTLHAGLIPVLHGDACLYGTHGAGILSGDTLMEMIAKNTSMTTSSSSSSSQLTIARAVFLTDTNGVYTKDPHKYPDTAELLTNIQVNANDGSLMLAQDLEVEGSRHEHDVTGGVKTKLASAAAIAAAGINVTIAKCGSVSAEQVIQNHPHVEQATLVFRTNTAQC